MICETLSHQLFYFAGDVYLLASGPAGRRQAGENAEHGALPAGWHGHGPTHGEEEPEQLEPPLSLVALETTLWPRP